ncbi:MAG: hypothetical protein EAY66_00665 [Sphingobacteriales bacterium]|jgi:hypothetical protein|nr:MAG: hypothetical protein EAY66_00665 [Sphingobacteriales bacterium]
MKNTLLAFIFIFLSQLAMAQSQSENNYSAGFNIISYGEVSKLLNEVRSAESYKSAKFNGIIAKFNDNQISYRLVASRYFDKEYKFYNECKECEYIKGKYTSYEIKLGFEKNLIYAKLQPFFGIDLGYKSITFNGRATDFKTVNTKGNYQAEIQKKGSLFYPFVGLKYSPINQITFSIESGYNVFWSFEKQIKRYDDINKTITNQNVTQWEFLNQPIGIFTIQYNFGAN